MTDLFLIRMLLTFFTGTAWIYLSIRLGKRAGSNISGFIAGLPSTALLVFFFIGVNQSTAAASEATTVFPLSYSVTGLFLLIYAAVVKRGLIPAVTLGIISWFAGAAAIALIRPENYFLNISGYLLILMLLYPGIRKLTGGTAPAGGVLPASRGILMIRSIAGGSIITAAVLASKLFGPLFGGIFSAFPAMFITTLVISHQTYGIDFSRKMTRTLLITGMSTIVPYSVGVRYFYPLAGLIPGTILALVLSSLFAAGILHLIREKRL